MILKWNMNQELNLTRETKHQKNWRHVMLTNCDVIVTFSIYSQLGVIRKPDSGRIVCKTYIFINSITFYHTETENKTKKSNTASIWFVWKEGLFSPKIIFHKKILTSAKLGKPWYWKVYFLKPHICLYLRTTFHVSSRTPTSFRQGVILWRFPNFPYLRRKTLQHLKPPKSNITG